MKIINIKYAISITLILTHKESRLDIFTDKESVKRYYLTYLAILMSVGEAPSLVVVMS